MDHPEDLLTICEPACQHLDHQEDLLTICEPAGQHLGHPEDLLTITDSYIPVSRTAGSCMIPALKKLNKTNGRK